jgi:CRP-like cAMP-binding protein
MASEAAPGANSSIPAPTRLESCASCPLWRHSFYGPLASPAFVARIRRARAEIGPRAIVLQEGAVAGSIFSLARGWMFRFVLLPDGRRQILSFYVPGDLVPHQALRRKPLTFSVETLTSVSACVFDAGEVAAWLSETPDRVAALSELWARESAVQEERIVDLGRRSAAERVSRFLLQLAARLVRLPLTTPISVSFPLRQVHVADALGLTVEHVSRTLTAFRRDGILSVAGGALTVNDPRRAAAIAGISSAW